VRFSDNCPNIGPGGSFLSTLTIAIFVGSPGFSIKIGNQGREKHQMFTLSTNQLKLGHEPVSSIFSVIKKLYEYSSKGVSNVQRGQLQKSLYAQSVLNNQDPKRKLASTIQRPKDRGIFPLVSYLF